MRRLGRSFVLVLITISAVAAGAFSVIALSYHRFSADLRKAGLSVPATVDAALSSTAGTLDGPQVILVRGSGRPASGAVVLVRTVPNGPGTAFLSIPGSALLAGQPITRLDTPGLIRRLRTAVGISVSHVEILTGRERRDRAERRVLRAMVDQALAPTSLTHLPETGRAIAGSTTDLTAADVLGLAWTRLDDRRVVQCSIVEHQAIDSAQGHATVAAFLAEAGDARLSACRATAVAGASFVPPRAVIAIVQDHGTWVFVALAAASMLMSMGAAGRFSRMRARARHGRRAGALRWRDHARDLREVSQAIRGAVVPARRALIVVAAKGHVSLDALVRASETMAAVGRVGHERVSAIRERAPMGWGTLVRSAYRSRVRRFVYLHQDALWIGLFAAVATGILIRLLAT